MFLGFFITGIGTAILLFLINVGPKRRGTGWNGAIGILVMLSCALCVVISPILSLNAIAIGAIGALFVDRRERIRATVLTVCATTILVSTLIICDIRFWISGREQYPIVSLAERLSYEDKSRRKTADKGGIFVIAVREARLEQRESMYHYQSIVNKRASTLEYIHKDVVELFVTSPGFGVDRTYLDRFRTVKEIEITDEKRRTILNWFDSWKKIHNDERPVAISDPLLHRLHGIGSVDFANPLSFGFVRNRNQVVGFESHALHKAIFPPGEIESWKCSKVELVSLLKFGAARVYVSDELPAMDQLKNAETRTLDPFEEESLEALRDGKDLEVRRSETEIRMLGSLRAADVCLKCHEVKRGDLLGAFSYRLLPSPAK